MVYIFVESPKPSVLSTEVQTLVHLQMAMVVGDAQFIVFQEA